MGSESIENNVSSCFRYRFRAHDPNTRVHIQSTRPLKWEELTGRSASALRVLYEIVDTVPRRKAGATVPTPADVTTNSERGVVSGSCCGVPQA